MLEVYKNTIASMEENSRVSERVEEVAALVVIIMAENPKMKRIKNMLSSLQ